MGFRKVLILPAILVAVAFASPAFSKDGNGNGNAFGHVKSNGKALGHDKRQAHEVPEIDVISGVAAVAAVLAGLALVAERRRAS